MVSTALQIGGVFGVAILASVATAASGTGTGAAALTDGYQRALTAGAGLALLGSAIASALALAARRRLAQAAGTLAPPPRTHPAEHLRSRGGIE
jgi:hypothetical protein